MPSQVSLIAPAKNATALATSGPAQSGAMRPMPGYAQHRMPIPGLYQTGATTHPGGSVTGGPGRNAAAVMLKDFGSSLEAVVKGKA